MNQIRLEKPELGSDLWDIECKVTDEGYLYLFYPVGAYNKRDYCTTLSESYIDIVSMIQCFAYGFHHDYVTINNTKFKIEGLC